MVTQTTERGSVFDVGALFEIPGHDVNRAVFRHVLYTRMGDTAIWKEVRKSIEGNDRFSDAYRGELLEGPMDEFSSLGALTHHVGMLDANTGELAAGGLPENPSAYNVVRKFKILKPGSVNLLGSKLVDYSDYPRENGFVVPLEFIVRLGITSASSVYRSYLRMNDTDRRAFESELGVNRPLEAWEFLERPVTDFTTKFEPTDRMLSKQEALVTSGLSGRLFIKGTKMAVLGALAVQQMLDGLGLSMWDIKWEFARDMDDLVYVDTIDTDSFRATLALEFAGKKLHCHFNKQSIRDYYRLLHPDWIEAISDAKKIAAAAGGDFTEILREGQSEGQYPENPEIDAGFRDLQVEKFGVISRFMLGECDLQGARDTLEECGKREIGFYEEKDLLKELIAINGIG